MNFKTDPRYVYLIRSEITTGVFQYKIGVSKNPDKRLLEIQTANPSDLKLVQKFMSDFPFILETALQNFFRLQNINGEWFELSDVDVSNFLNTCIKIESGLKIIRDSSTLYS